MQAQVEAVNKECPMTVGDVTVASFSINKQELTINYLFDLDDFSIALIEDQADVVAPEIINGLKSSNQETRDMVKACKDEKIGLKLVFKNYNGATSTINIPYTKL